MQWTLIETKNVYQAVPFIVQALELVDNRTNKPVSHPFHRLKSPDWVNILAVTESGDAILVNQQRAGTMEYNLEIPGGVIDQGEDPLKAATRELEEETGYICQNIIKVSSINPNPAIMTNTLHMYLATGCRLAEKRTHFPDANESIEVLAVPLDELDGLIRQQKINSALAALTYFMALKHLNS